MLPWVEAGVRASLAEYNRLTGRPAPTKLPFLGPRREVRQVTLASREIDSNEVYSDTAYTLDERWWTTGFGNQELGEPTDFVLFRDCSFTGGTKWASRSYRMRDGNKFLNCAWRNTWPEHDIYWNLMGLNRGDSGYSQRPAVFFQDCYWQDTGSQATQFVQREREWYGDVDPKDLTPGGPIAYLDCLSRNAGLGLEHPEGIEGKGYEGDPRPAFALSHFKSKNNVLMRRVMVDKTMQTRSSGLLLVEGRPRCVVHSSVFMTGNTTQPLAIFRDVEELVIRNTFWHAREGQNWISLENCRRVFIEGCDGNTKIKVGAQMLPINGGYISG